jgi:hypothetical protein
MSTLVLDAPRDHFRRKSLERAVRGRTHYTQRSCVGAFGRWAQDKIRLVRPRTIKNIAAGQPPEKFSLRKLEKILRG